MDAPYRTETKEVDGREYRVEFYVDWDADTSWMGEWTDKDQEYCVDAKESIILGKETEPPEGPLEPENVRWILKEPIPQEWELYHEKWDKWREDYNAWKEQPYEVLGDTVTYRNWRQSHSLRYFVPQLRVEDFDADQEWVKYAEDVYRRIVGLYHGDWYFVGIAVTTQADPCLTCDHSEEIIESLWGIDGDPGEGDGYIEGIIAELIGQAQERL